MATNHICAIIGSVKLIQTGINRFTVQYGLSNVTGLNYDKAAKDFGACIMHELACEGRLDSRTRDECNVAGDFVPYFSAASIVE